jgi:hypothetical protein
MLKESKILVALDIIATERLFGAEEWLVNNVRTATELAQILEGFGLREAVPNATDTTRTTEIGKKLNGMFEPWDAIVTLELADLISEDESAELYRLLEMAEKECEPLLRARVQRVYRRYRNAITVH